MITNIFKTLNCISQFKCQSFTTINKSNLQNSINKQLIHYPSQLFSSKNQPPSHDKSNNQYNSLESIQKQKQEHAQTIQIITEHDIDKLPLSGYSNQIKEIINFLKSKIRNLSQKVQNQDQKISNFIQRIDDLQFQLTQQLNQNTEDIKKNRENMEKLNEKMDKNEQRLQKYQESLNFVISQTIRSQLRQQFIDDYQKNILKQKLQDNFEFFNQNQLEFDKYAIELGIDLNEWRRLTKLDIKRTVNLNNRKLLEKIFYEEETDKTLEAYSIMLNVLINRQD